MSNNLSMKDFYSSEQITAILTYTYLKYKEQAGYPLTADEKDLLYNKEHQTFLSMAFNNNGYYPCSPALNGFKTHLDLESFVKCMVIEKMNSHEQSDLFVECNIQQIFQEALSMIPAGFIEPKFTRTVQFNTVKYSEDKIVLVARIDTEFGTIVKGYVFIPPTMERFRKYCPDFVVNIENKVYQNRFMKLMNDMNYAIGRTLFDNDFEPLFYGDASNIPREMYSAVKFDYTEIIRLGK